MNKNLYFNGEQIKSYLVAFGSLFSEIPYKDGHGNVKTVPIYYGSPSDVISYFENDVEEQKTKNRLKDITLPMFSFRLTGIEKNPERRKAPTRTITVDLRKYGYATGYVILQPTPYNFNFELTLWASSDIQCFEILEQILPYFNTPVAVSVQILPASPVQSVEVFFDSIDIDTDPSSQKYSAQATLQFHITGALLSQPKVWSTNNAFELEFLVESDINAVREKYSEFDMKEVFPYDGMDMIDENSVRKVDYIDDIMKEFFVNFETFLKKINVYSDIEYKFLVYKEFYNNGIIDSKGNIIEYKNTTLNVNGVDIEVDKEFIDYIVSFINDYRYMFVNDVIDIDMKYSKYIEDYADNLKMMFEDKETMEYLYKLAQNGFVDLQTYTINENMTTSDILKVFGKLSVDISAVEKRLKNYLSVLNRIKILTDGLISIKYYKSYDDVSYYKDDIDLEKLKNIYNYDYENDLSYNDVVCCVCPDKIVFSFLNDFENIGNIIFYDIDNKKEYKKEINSSVLKYDKIALEIDGDNVGEYIVVVEINNKNYFKLIKRKDNDKRYCYTELNEINGDEIFKVDEIDCIEKYNYGLSSNRFVEYDIINTSDFVNAYCLYCNGYNDFDEYVMRYGDIAFDEAIGLIKKLYYKILMSNKLKETKMLTNSLVNIDDLYYVDIVAEINNKKIYDKNRDKRVDRYDYEEFGIDVSEIDIDKMTYIFDDEKKIWLNVFNEIPEYIKSKLNEIYTKITSLKTKINENHEKYECLVDLLNNDIIDYDFSLKVSVEELQNELKLYGCEISYDDILELNIVYTSYYINLLKYKNYVKYLNKDDIYLSLLIDKFNFDKQNYFYYVAHEFIKYNDKLKNKKIKNVKYEDILAVYSELEYIIQKIK